MPAYNRYFLICGEDFLVGGLTSFRPPKGSKTTVSSRVDTSCSCVRRLDWPCVSSIMYDYTDTARVYSLHVLKVLESNELTNFGILVC